MCDIPGELINELNVRIYAKVLLHGVLAVQEKKSKSSCWYLPRLVVIRRESKTLKMPQLTWKLLGKHMYESEMLLISKQRGFWCGRWLRS